MRRHEPNLVEPSICAHCLEDWPCAGVALLTIPQAAERAGRTVRQVEYWIAQGLPVHWVGGVRKIRTDLLLAMKRAQFETRGGKGKPRFTKWTRQKDA